MRLARKINVGGNYGFGFERGDLIEIERPEREDYSFLDNMTGGQPAPNETLTCPNCEAELAHDEEIYYDRQEMIIGCCACLFSGRAGAFLDRTVSCEDY